MSTFNSLVGLVDAKTPEFLALSDRIWDNPEIRYQEHGATAEHIAMLEKQGFRVTRDIAGIPTAFIGEAGSGGPVIAILGEFDALAGLSQESGVAEPRPLVRNGNGHGCGHNLLGTAALLAATAVKDHLEATGQPGTVRYYGCPAEEGGSGKTFMARAGAFEDIDVALSWHPWPFNGIMNIISLANVQVFFRFKGRASHAASSPELGRGALDAVELMSVGVQYMREHMPSEARVHSAITNTGGISPNVVQADAEVLYLIRSPEIDDVWTLYERVKKIAEGAALMTETSVEWEIDRACSNIMPNTALESAMHANMLRLGPPPFDAADYEFAGKIQATLSAEDIAFPYRSYNIPQTDTKPLHDGICEYTGEPWFLPGSTDVGDVSWLAPTAQCVTACHAIGTPGHSWQLVAQGKMPLAHKGLVLAAKTLATTAMDVIAKPELLRQAKSEHARRLSGNPYRCPIPDEVVPPCHRAAA